MFNKCHTNYTSGIFVKSFMNKILINSCTSRSVETAKLINYNTLSAHADCSIMTSGPSSPYYFARRTNVTATRTFFFFYSIWS